MLFVADVPVVSQTTGPYISLFELLTKGGIIMIPIFLLSVITVFIFSEKLIYIIKSTKAERNLSYRLIEDPTHRVIGTANINGLLNLSF